MSSVKDWDVTNPLKTNRSGHIGKGVDRYEGPLKVTGTAPYAYEVQPPSPPAYGVMIGAAMSTRATRPTACECRSPWAAWPAWTSPPPRLRRACWRSGRT